MLDGNTSPALTGAKVTVSVASEPATSGDGSLVGSSRYSRPALSVTVPVIDAGRWYSFSPAVKTIPPSSINRYIVGRTTTDGRRE